MLHHHRFRAGVLVATSVLAVASLAPTSATASAKAKPGPEYLTASVDFTSVITTRCPAIVGIDAFTTDVTTTIYRHSVEGTGPLGKSKGSMEITGESIYSIVRTVEGKSDTMKPYTIGPTTRPIATRSSTWKGVVRKVTAGKKKGRQRYTSYLDFTGIDPTLDAQVFAPIPKPGVEHTYPVKGDDRKKDLTDQGGGCTSSEVLTVSGSVTYGRHKKR